VKTESDGLGIFSAYIFTKAMEMEFSAALLSRAMFNSSEYFFFPDPKLDE
jgi:hypothetical protein